MTLSKTNELNRSIKKSLAVLTCFNEDNMELRLSEIASKLDMPLPTASRIINALLEEGFIEREEKKKIYRLGVKCYYLGAIAQKAGLLRNIAYEQMAALRNQFNETVNLYVRDGKYRVVYDQMECSHSLRRSVRIGEKFPLYVGASGRCLMAYMLQSEVREILKDAVKITEHTIVDIEPVNARLEEIRRNGYDISVSEREEGILCVASTILEAWKKAAGVIALTGPSFRFTDDVLSVAIPAVKNAAAAVSARLNE
ncbi:MAG: IclR family transcriptional regulator [Synergistaceae bacterium]|nr:IclR family transcriptional regulator [Synergistaceae bacterium]